MNDQKQAQGATGLPLVPFEKGITINPARRMPAFDTGLSLAYEARDAQGGVLVALVCEPRGIPRLTQISSYDLLVDKVFMRLAAHGVCFWPADSAERYVLVYRTAHDSVIIDENGKLRPPWRSNEIMEYFIRPMISALQELGERNFCHGAIRAENVYSSSSTNPTQSIILGDCLSAQPSSLQPVIYESVERALADPMARGAGTIADDIYAFGITLVMLLRTQNPMEGLSDEQIIKRKVENGSYFSVVGRERFSTQILALLKGVLHDNPDTRWGLPEITAWLEGGRVSTPPPIARKKATRPITFMGEKYLYATALAVDMHKNPKELAEMVESEELLQWAEKALGDKDLVQRYHEAVDRIAKHGRGDEDFLICNMKLVFAPKFAMHYKGVNFTPEGIGGALASACYLRRDLGVYKAIILSNICSVAFTLRDLPQGVVFGYIRKFDRAKNSLRQIKMGFGGEYCIYVLCEDAFCMSPNLQGKFIHGRRAMLAAFEQMAQTAGQTAYFLDPHSAAMMNVQDSGTVEHAMFELNAIEKEKKFLGNLKCLAGLQRRAGNALYPAIARVFMEGMAPQFRVFHNRKLRKQVEEAVAAAASRGDLMGMEDALCNENLIARDNRGFQIAMYEYAKLHAEKKDLRYRMQYKQSFGTGKGHEVASIVAWGIAGMTAFIMVLAHLSGGGSIF